MLGDPGESVWTVALRPRALADLAVGGRTYLRGEVVPLYLASARFLTRPYDDPPSTPFDVSLLDALNHSRHAYETGQGYPVVGGSSFAEPGKIVVAHRDGSRAWWRRLAFDGAEVEVREGGYEVNPVGDRVPVAYSRFATWLRGVVVGRPRIGDQKIELTVTDLFARRLTQPVQRNLFLGLGGRLELDGTNDHARLPAAALAPLSAAFTAVVLVSGRDLLSATTLGYVVCCGVPLIGPWFFRQSGANQLRGRVVLASGGSVYLNVDNVANDEPIWLALGYDGVRASLRALPVDGSRISTSRSSSPFAVAGPLASGGDLVVGAHPSLTTFFRGTVSELRIYDRALDDAELLRTAGRPLDLADPADAVGLLHYFPFDERWQTSAFDLVTGAAMAITGATWGTTGEGPAELRGTPKPRLLGEAELVPLVEVDARLGVWMVSDLPVGEWVRVYSAGLVGLAPTWQATRADFVFRASSRTLTTAGGSFESLVPGARLEVVGAAANPGPLTVAEVIDARTLRVDEALVDEAPASATLRVLAPGWEVYGPGIRVTGAVEGPLVAWVRGDVATVGEQLVHVLQDMAPGLTPAELSTAALGPFADAPSSLYLPPEPTTALAVLDRLVRPLGLHYGTEDGAVLEVGRLTLPAEDGEPFETFLREEVESLELLDLDVPPATLAVAYAPIFLTANDSQIRAAAEPEVAARARAPHLLVEDPPPDGFLDLWPAAVAAAPIETTLRTLADAKTRATEAAAIAREGILYRVRVRRGAPALRLGHLVRIFYGDPTAPFEARTGFEAGRLVTLVGLERVPMQGRLVLDVLAREESP